VSAARPRRIVAGVLVAVLTLLALRDLSRLGGALPWRTMDDFSDFYCAGSVLDGGADPYAYEPLHSCEHRVASSDTFRGRLFAANPALAVPAPQPPFDFLPYMALARVPFPTARVLAALAIVAAVAVAMLGLAALGVPWPIAIAALIFSTAYASLNTGQIVPFSLVSLVICGVALARGGYTAAGVFAVLTAIEPAVGIPVIAATAIFVPRTRIAIAIGLAALATLSVALVGWSVLLRYVAEVIPAHSLTELHFPFQYSAAYVAAHFGASPPLARLAGTASYLVLVALGLIVGRKAAASLRRPELIAFVPALCAVTGGIFVHGEELCFAIPAAAIVAISTTGRARSVAAVALCVLSIPWIAVWGTKQLFLASLVVCVVIVIRLGIPAATAIGILVAAAATIYAFELQPPQLPVPTALPRAYEPAGLVQRAWADYTAARATDDPLWFAIKLPTWAALLAVLALAYRCAVRSPLASESSPESSRETQDRPTASPRVRTD
jgi:hypothetical protein